MENIIRSQIEVGHAKLSFQIIYHSIQDDFEGTLFDDKILSIETFKLKHKVPTHGFLFKEKPKLRPLLDDLFKASGLSIREIPKLKAGESVTDDEGKFHDYKDLTGNPKPSMSYAYVSDSMYSENVIKWVKGVHVMYHEATFLIKEADRAKSTMHSTTEMLGKVVKKQK